MRTATSGLRRVVLADVRREVRSALQLLLEQEPDLLVVAEANAADGLLAEVRTAQPDVVVVAWDLPASHSVPSRADALQSLITDLHAATPRVSVVVLGSWPELRVEALTAGADAFVSKVDPPEQVIKALRDL